MKYSTLATSALALTLAAGAAKAETSAAAVLETYANIAEAGYADSLITARALSDAVDALIAAPSEQTLAAARAAWIAARVPYQQTEVYRFGNPIVDDWEGKVNAWPLDEGLIDYVAGDYVVSDENEFAALNIIANTAFTIAGEEVDASEITPGLLESLHELDGIEANVATGYHAIEFLLWGQDLNGTGSGAGDRPHTDFAGGDACTGGNCGRRAAYLRAATDLLIADLEEMEANWAAGGAAREAAMADEAAGLSAMLTGMGSLSYGELAGERMRLGLMLGDPEEEHDCFSDNTHWSHYYDGLGIQNVYHGRYTRIDGSVVEGASLAELMAQSDPALDADMQARLDATMVALGEISDAAEGGLAYDQMLAMGNAEGEALIMGGVNALIDQTRAIERIVAALDLGGIALEGSNSLDNPGAVFE
ncbi:imelysin family protein [Sinisalibacter lacisalsi]|uniref:Peptidase n=1 Tax=Sinisalibacter lacisalsi TaxID=1526570 RepID=A0ABQ1QE92_9RHOB|nr:imelysin family protein [Sinisalibacter lacisalsi]GGD23137.1 peptidase [Sinisalibacter lacisalsi]